MSQELFSIDLGEQNIRIADIQKEGGLLRIDGIGSTPINTALYQVETSRLVSEAAQQITQLIQKAGIKKKKVAVVIPDAVTYSRFIEMPKLNEKEMLSAIKYQADQFIPMPLEDINLDIEMVYENDKTKQSLALVVAAPKTIVNKVEKILLSAGLVPESLESEISATARFLAELHPPTKVASQSEHQGVLYVNMGYNTTSLYFFDTTRNVMTFNHMFPIGINLFLKVIQANLNIERPKAQEMLAQYGLLGRSDFHTDMILTPVIKDILKEIQISIALLKDKYSSTVTNMQLYHTASQLKGFDQIVTAFFHVPTTFLHLEDRFVKNQLFSSIGASLPSFIPVFGGNLK